MARQLRTVEAMPENRTMELLPGADEDEARG